MQQLLCRKYLALLLALIALFVVYPILRDTIGGRLLSDVLISVIFFAAFLAIFADKPLRMLALLLGIPSLVGAWVGYILPGFPRLPLDVGFHLVAALFFSLTVATILRSIRREKLVSADSIYGAFCGYLLVGLVFAHLFRLIETMVPGSFHGNDILAAHLQDEERRHFLLVYFSFITLTTVGYGDITPASEGARSLAVIEAVVGQFYIAVLIGELIGKRVSQVLSEQRADRADSGGNDVLGRGEHSGERRA